MTKIIALSGRAQSGKTTLMNYVHGYELLRHDIIEKFFLSSKGELVVNCTSFKDDGSAYHHMGILDLKNNTNDFYTYAEKNIWPLVKGYNFADSLKEICEYIFNIPYECLWGSDQDKNSLQPHLLWENMPGVMRNEFQMNCVDWQSYAKYFSTSEPKTGPMTAREFMQFFGTEIMRKIYEPIWIESCLKRIKNDNPAIAIIGDCRFINEVNAIKKNNGIVVRLTRNISNIQHSSEIELDNYNYFDFLLNNTNVTLQESCNMLINFLISSGVTTPIQKK